MRGIRRRYAGRTIVPRALTALVLVVPLLLVRGDPGLPPAPSVAAPPLARLPAALLPAMNATLATDDPSYAVTPVGGASFLATNPTQGMTATFAPDGVTIGARGNTPWRFRFSGIGDGATFLPVPDTAPVADDVRVEYRRGNLTEWYVNGPVGIEQGFTIATPPGASDTMALALSVVGTKPAPDGDDVLLTLPGGTTQRYRGLIATDARGMRLPARLAVADDTIRIIVATAGAAWPVTVDPFVETHTFAASDAVTSDALGVPVAVDTAGDVIVAAAKHKTISGSVVGEVYIWHVGASSTSFQIPGTGFGAGSGFGTGIAVSGDGQKVAIGIPTATTPKATNAGTVLVYSAPFYDHSVGLYANNGKSGDGYGSSIAMNHDGSIVAVGAPGRSVVIPPPSSITIPSVGAAYLEYGPGYNSEQTYAGELSTGDYHTDQGFEMFGSSVALDTNGVTLAVGEPGYDPTGGSAGAIDVFNTSGSGSLIAHLTASDAGTADTLGASVAVSADGKFVVGGAPDQTGSFANQGAAYIFSGTNYGTQAKLNDPSPASSDYFGTSVAVSGNGSMVAVGTFNKNKVFVYNGPPYSLVQTITGNSPNTHFGDGMALSADGTTLVSGAPGEKDGMISQAGIIHIFTQQVPTSLPGAQPHGPNGGGPPAPLPSPPQPKGPNGGSPSPLPPRRP